MIPPILGFWIFGQNVGWGDIPVVALLVLLEGVLSIDNALVLGLLAKRLPKHEQSKALWYGLGGAFVFRFFAVILASFLLRWTFAKLLGGGYLVYIAVRHLFFEHKGDEKESIKLDDQGNPILVEEQTGQPVGEEREESGMRGRMPVYMTPETRKKLGLARFWPTVLMIELTDIAFAVDSILAAIAMVGAPPPNVAQNAPHPKLWVVIFGGIIGLMLMRVAARLFIQLLERFPRFEIAAYLLVIVIGLKLLNDWAGNSDWSVFPKVEAARAKLADDYEWWLDNKWVLGPVPPHKPAPGRPKPVFDFHEPRRPEFILFWSLMVICFCVGFLPPRERKPQMATTEAMPPGP